MILKINLFMFLHQQWDADLVEARYIKDLEDNLSIIRLKFGESSKPLFRNREFIVYERRETMEDGTLVNPELETYSSVLNHIKFFVRNADQELLYALQVVAVASLPKEIAAGLHPKQNNAIRGLLLQSGWVVEKLENDSCIVTYVAQVTQASITKMREIL